MRDLVWFNKGSDWCGSTRDGVWLNERLDVVQCGMGFDSMRDWMWLNERLDVAR